MSSLGAGSAASPRNDGLLLRTPPIHRRHRDLRKLDAVNAAHIERYHFGAVRLVAAREDVDAAIDAELMSDGVLVEEIFLQIFFAGAQLEMSRRQEGEVQSFL